MKEDLPDYYSILGVLPYTNSEGIRRAYLFRARQYHPDLNHDDPDAQLKMSIINEAYKTLSHPDRRAEYDTRRTRVYIQLPPQHPGPPHISWARDPGPRRNPEPARHLGGRHRSRKGSGVIGTTLVMCVKALRHVFT